MLRYSTLDQAISHEVAFSYGMIKAQTLKQQARSQLMKNKTL